jgi:hypothetical protein
VSCVLTKRSPIPTLSRVSGGGSGVGVFWLLKSVLKIDRLVICLRNQALWSESVGIGFLGLSTSA